MKLDYSYQEISSLFIKSSIKSDEIITSITYDSRTISVGNGILFFALKGSFRDGHDFIEEAYSKGVRHFVVQDPSKLEPLSNAKGIIVKDSFIALQTLAAHHRSRFSYPIVAIIGSHGKTTVKEWLGELLSTSKSVVKSPKSYNSRLGVALSLLELHSNAEIGIIEASITEPGDMEVIHHMIQPTHGILTSISTNKSKQFVSQVEYIKELSSLFANTTYSIHPDSISLENGIPINIEQFPLIKAIPFTDSIHQQNAVLAANMAIELGVDHETVSQQLGNLEALASRLEVFEGINDSIILNDSYNLDLESLAHALDYQLANSQQKNRIIVVGLSKKDSEREDQIQTIIDSYQPITTYFHYYGSDFKESFENASILFKGERSVRLEQIARSFKRMQHQTFLEVNLRNIRKNIHLYKSALQKGTQLLCMVKASSYGSNAKKMGVFLEQIGINYLGVAYPNEGVELREAGVKIPILVMNCELDQFSQCVAHNLEPAIFSLRHLDAFIRELIVLDKMSYPIHIKIETGMNRLGFHEEDVSALIQQLQSQPEVLVKSVYSHLAESDIENSNYTKRQIALFEKITQQLEALLPLPFLRHILNSEGIVNYPNAQFDMARLGIGMYGISSQNTWKSKLEPAISWYSVVSQVNRLSAGETIGYGRSYTCEKDMEIATIPVGYADGFSRALGNGIGGVYINNNYCPTVGNVCMDMIMIDVTNLNIKESDQVEIIGPNQQVEVLAKAMNTIPYEVMTRFSSRIHRVFIEQ